EADFAMAGFAIVQWIQLDWPMPDVVIPMPDRHSMLIGSAFAQILNVPFAKALRWNLDYREDRLEEDLVCLMFDAKSSLADLKKGSRELLRAFPKRIYILSLGSYVDRVI